MNASVTRLLWAALILCAFFYGTYLFFGSVILSAEEHSYKELAIRETRIDEETVRLYGMLFVDNTCDEISLSVNNIEEKKFELLFSTWQRPFADCMEEQTPRAFRTTLFSGRGASYTASLNGEFLKLNVVRTDL